MQACTKSPGPSLSDRACAIDTHAAILASRLNHLLVQLTGSGVPQGEKVQEQPSGVADVLARTVLSLQECADILKTVEGVVGQGDQRAKPAFSCHTSVRADLPSGLREKMAGMAQDIRAEYRPNSPSEMGCPSTVANDIKQDLVRIHDRIARKQGEIRRLDAEFESGLELLPPEEQILVNKACRRELA